jgi:16S rRNA (adenine1518-N6/adenine1519-N6)-dimethyltransferase
MVKPKKHLGQHFLTDPDIARRIVDALAAGEEDTVMEIGPGTGVLTSLLLERDLRLVPVEIDRESAAYLRNRWPELEKHLIEGDFLELDLNVGFPERMHIIGNFPYNISSQIFFRILEQRARIHSVVCMLQKEVADRISAPPGSKTYGILSVLLQAYYNVIPLFRVKPGSFHPPPKVVSGVIRLERNNTERLPCNEDLFFRVVKATFNQRRKMIRNSIRSILLNLDGDMELLDRRPEQLSVEQFTELSCWVQDRLEAEGQDHSNEP